MKNKTLPTTEGLDFLICEYIRNEDGGKLSLLGVFTGGGILVNGFEPGLMMPSLSLYFSFSDGEGQFDAKFGLIGPDGNEIVQHAQKDALKKPNQNMNFGFQIAPFRLRLGNYMGYVDLDGTRYEKKFSIMSADAQTPVT